MVPGVRHRHHGELLRPGAGEFQTEPGQSRHRLRHRLHRPRLVLRMAENGDAEPMLLETES
jgi:hypothetical protein